MKHKLSEYLRLVSSGETVQVTVRGRVVAELVPPRAGSSLPPADTKWEETVRKGLLTPATVVSGEPPPRMPVTSFETLMRELSGDREDR